jgi:hypothetical protein
LQEVCSDPTGIFPAEREKLDLEASPTRGRRAGAESLDCESERDPASGQVVDLS